MSTTAILGALLLLVLAPTRVLLADEAPLFTSTEPLALELSLNLKDLCRAKDRRDCGDVPATLKFLEADGAGQSLPVRVSTRGGWRLEEQICDVPPLFLTFEEGQASGTVFEGQTVLPLTSYCRRNRDWYMKYVLKEYVAYRLYGLFTTKNVKARLAQVSYRDISKERAPRPRISFFSEHFAAVAERNSAEFVELEHVSPMATDPVESTTLAIFQYMIGNTDWSTISSHNIVYIRSAEGALSAVPYDFDFSGIVNARYAGPPPGLPIYSVRQRLYRGFCFTGLDWEPIFETFQQKRTSVFEVIREISRFSRDAAVDAADYVQRFYDTLDSPRHRQQRIERACR
jgi:hypothetical protein